MKPLKALEILYRYIDEGSYLEEFEVIKTALKRLEKLEQNCGRCVLVMSRSRGQMKRLIDELSNHPTVLVSNVVDVQKVKCFEILKDEFEFWFNDKEQIIKIQYGEEPYTHIQFGLSKKIKDKAKYDLLKEYLK